ncbi:MAG: alternative ribosome rescue aminoacyl-tRNA hydrolase ArfB [Acidimicrobiales bacterium]
MTPPAADDLVVNDHLIIPASELSWRFSTSSGPGGQHANTANTRAEVTFDVDASAVLTDGDRRRLRTRFGQRVSVAADDTRSQARNRALARDRLAARMRDALVRRPRRQPTKPSRGARQRRLESKRRRARLKSDRRRPRLD